MGQVTPVTARGCAAGTEGHHGAVGDERGTAPGVGTPTGTELVDAAVLRRPKTLPATASVGDVRRLLGDHVHAALLVDGPRLAGVVVRDDLEGAGDDEPALALGALAGRTVRSGTPLAAAQAALQASGQRRVAVVDAEGALVGLLCRKRKGDGWCTDAGVAARRREREGPAA